jgi:hypothetical protein
VSFIPTGTADRERTLPQVPRFERAEAPAVRRAQESQPRFQPAPDADAQAHAARIETAPRWQPALREPATPREPTMAREAVMPRAEAAQPARMRAPDFDAQLRERRTAQPQPQPQRFERPPEFRAMPPVSHEIQRAAPAPQSAPPVHPRHEPPRRADQQR